MIQARCYGSFMIKPQQAIKRCSPLITPSTAAARRFKTYALSLRYPIAGPKGRQIGLVECFKGEEDGDRPSPARGGSVRTQTGPWTRSVTASEVDSGRIYIPAAFIIHELSPSYSQRVIVRCGGNEMESWLSTPANGHRFGFGGRIQMKVMMQTLGFKKGDVLEFRAEGRSPAGVPVIRMEMVPPSKDPKTQRMVKLDAKLFKYPDLTDSNFRSHKLVDSGSIEKTLTAAYHFEIKGWTMPRPVCEYLLGTTASRSDRVPLVLLHDGKAFPGEVFIDKGVKSKVTNKPWYRRFFRSEDLFNRLKLEPGDTVRLTPVDPVGGKPAIEVEAIRLKEGVNNITAFRSSNLNPKP